MKVACFGDSWTFGYGLDRKETWPYFFKNISNYDVENISQCGSSNREIFDAYKKCNKGFDILIFCWSGITRTPTDDGFMEFCDSHDKKIDIRRGEYFANISMQELFDRWENFMIQINEENKDKKVFHFSVFGEKPTKHIDNFYTPSFLEYLANEQGNYFKYDIPIFEFDFLNQKNLHITEPFAEKYWDNNWKRACVEREYIRPGKNFLDCGHPNKRGCELWAKYVWSIINEN